MDKKAEWIERVLSVSLSGEAPPAGEAPLAAAAAPAPEPAGAPADEDPFDASMFNEWMDDLNAQASLLPPAAKADLQAQIKAARGTLNPPDPPKIFATLEAIADALALAAKSARVGAAVAQAGTQVAYRVLQRQFQQAESDARAQFESFLADLLNDPDLEADSRYPDLVAAAPRLTSLFPDDGGELEQELGDLNEATSPQEISAARDRAIKAAKAYTARLDQAEQLRDLQELSDDEYDGTPFYAGLKHSLAELRVQLESSK